jgi:hypothetical protein
MDIQFCQGLGLESQKLVIQLDNIYNPASPWDIFIQDANHVLVNGVNIYSDITGTITAYDNADYLTMGRNIGNGMKLAALGPAVRGNEKYDIVNDIVGFANGYIEGIMGGFDLPRECISDF